jgi:hypothetical protein
MGHDMLDDMVGDIGGDMLHLRSGFTEIGLWRDLANHISIAGYARGGGRVQGGIGGISEVA